MQRNLELALNPKSLWHHPILPIFIEEEAQPTVETQDIPTKLYLVPTLDNPFGEEVDQEFLPSPSPRSELPDISSWVKRYVIGVVEIWSAKRPASQLLNWSHRKVYKQLINPSLLTKGAKIRKIYISEPIEGVIEATVTLRISERVRSLSLRFEGVDKRWLCTELLLI
jgi:hypothetical protein